MREFKPSFFNFAALFSNGCTIATNQPLRGRFGKAPAKPKKRGVGIGNTYKANVMVRWYSR